MGFHVGSPGKLGLLWEKTNRWDANFGAGSLFSGQTEQ
jgi:hypothetical protein